MSFGEGDLHTKVAQLTTENSRLMDVNGRLCAEINRQEGRIRELESLARDTFDAWCFECDPWADDFACAHFDGDECGVKRRMAALGLLEGGDA